MKMLKKICIFLLVALMLTAPVACRKKTDGTPANSQPATDTGAGSQKTEAEIAQEAAEAAAHDDRALLEAAGFDIVNVTANEYSLPGCEARIKAEKGDLIGFLDAQKRQESKVVMIYYFADAAKAQKCYNENWKDNAIYRCVGAKLIWDASGENVFD